MPADFDRAVAYIREHGDEFDQARLDELLGEGALPSDEQERRFFAGVFGLEVSACASSSACEFASSVFACCCCSVEQANAAAGIAIATATAKASLRIIVCSLS